MLDISLVQMKYAIEVYKAGSISRAAKKLSMNQPNLSKSIKELEDSLGIEIFVRTPKGVIVSKEGQVFLEYADAIFQKMDEMEDGLRECKENKVPLKFLFQEQLILPMLSQNLSKTFKVLRKSGSIIERPMR